ncbi:MAG TPA: DJ-1/PfpI family protein [Gordonia sp. (in: high G+C Gram-positive bacteria)]|uniref:DJ-1/PfpI family protein n=1 Tax=unclassified Gordonia (in: high G+C Gram-positive bacteria) TaxID=2657482 RepID=UPI0025BFCE21|nr:MULTISPECIES: DJ-1/PfpI family protein [unclassified Gordonia (in: high G+C Gram-positive bacteria)]HNP58484.1 DJ-1/PfpI family protein [Gordonia sp. (in: high G+C Gram-positive bacteria)]HRC52200.1 DJ-1/PfpI family protein [Gordonia sp. (in: high G+C Gram-positive bacteria)]
MTQIAIVVYPRFTALDLVGPYEVLRGLPGADIRFVAHEPGPVVADSGVLAIGATHAFDETPSPDIVLVPGGPGSASAARDEGLLSWLRTVSPGADWTASVCTGSVVLAAAGLLEGRRATTHWSSLRLLPMFGAVAVDDERIVVEADRRIATAAGVSAGIDLALWLAAQVAGEDRARAIQLMIEYDPQPPFDSGQRSKASKSTVAASTALLSRDLIEPTTMADGVVLAWQGTLATIRRKARRRR